MSTANGGSAVLPFALLDKNHKRACVLLGLGPQGLVGLDPIRDLYFDVEPGHILGAVSAEPAAVYFGLVASFGAAEERLAANGRVFRFRPMGDRFPTLPPTVLSGYPIAARAMQRHREFIPDVDTVRVSALFAVSTIRDTIKQAELAYQCFGRLYLEYGRQMPLLSELRGCFRGLANVKSAIFQGVAEYAPIIRAYIQRGYRDGALRRALALETDMPNGLGLAKLSFTLALLGHDTVCIDARLQSVMFSEERRKHFDDAIEKRRGRLSERAVKLYEDAERAFLTENPHYDPHDPVGAARAQWLSWEAVGGAGASHESWLRLLPQR